ncbi:hypothetical protein Trydic_g17749 [Trypoxylus dichotomus]
MLTSARHREEFQNRNANENYALIKANARNEAATRLKIRGAICNQRTMRTCGYKQLLNSNSLGTQNHYGFKDITNTTNRQPKQWNEPITVIGTTYLSPVEGCIDKIGRKLGKLKIKLIFNASKRLITKFPSPKDGTPPFQIPEVEVCMESRALDKQAETSSGRRSTADEPLADPVKIFIGVDLRLDDEIVKFLYKSYSF